MTYSKGETIFTKMGKKRRFIKRMGIFHNLNEQLGKNITLYKTHKQNIQIRLLTTGCNTAIENPAIFVEKHQMRTYQQK